MIASSRHRWRASAVVAISALLLTLAVLEGSSIIGSDESPSFVTATHLKSANQTGGGTILVPLIANGTQTPGVYGSSLVWSFNLTATGNLSGVVSFDPTGEYNGIHFGIPANSYFFVVNDSEYRSVVAPNSTCLVPGYAFNSCPPSVFFNISTEPLPSKQVFNFTDYRHPLSHGGWHIFFIEDLNPPSPSFPPGPILTLNWTGGLWVDSMGSVRAISTSPPPFVPPYP